MAPKKKAKNGQNDAVIAAQKKQVDQLRKLVSLHRENARAILQRLQQQLDVPSSTPLKANGASNGFQIQLLWNWNPFDAPFAI